MANPEIRTRITGRERLLITEIGRRMCAPGVEPTDAMILRFCLHHGALAVGIAQPSSFGLAPDGVDAGPPAVGPCPEGVMCRAFGCTPAHCNHPF